MTCARVSPLAFGVLALGGQRLAAPVRVLGIDLWVSPSPPFRLLSAGSTASGGAEFPLPIPGHPRLAGSGFHLQYFWIDACAAGGLSASNGLSATVQP